MTVTWSHARSITLWGIFMDIHDLCRYGKRIQVGRGEIISDGIEGSEDDYMYVLDKGLAALTSTNKKGDEFIYLFFRGPRCIGFAPLVRQFLGVDPMPSIHEPAMFTILAKSDCELYRIDRKTFAMLHKEQPFRDLMMNIVFTTYMEVLYHYYTSRETSAAGRLCWLIMEQSEPDDSESLVLDPLFTYDELSHYLGVHSITVARIMSALKKTGAITKSGRKTIINDLGKLRAVIDDDLVLDY